MMKTEKLNLTTEWDKTFPEGDKVVHSKVTFVNRYGITLAAERVRYLLTSWRASSWSI